MVDLSEMSSVGVGTYRMQVDECTHFDALVAAIEGGYNVIDTATNYSNGKSEKLLGKLLESYPAYSRELFIISKTGYIPKKNERTDALKTFVQEQVEEIAIIDEDFEYSLDPNFIDYQIEQSLKNIGRSYLDVYLLHNPERYLQSKNLNSLPQLYQSIKAAFELLEQKVKEGKIRYYGLSSNRMFYPDKEGSISCAVLLEIAQSLGDEHHFKFLQFPFNFREQLALEPTYKGQSLLELAKENDLVTIGNRPLNMDENGLEFRLVTHEEQLLKMDASQTKLWLENFYQQLEERVLLLTNGESKLDDFEPPRLLKKYWNAFQSKGAVDAFFVSQLLPFVKTIFEEDYSQVEENLEKARTAVIWQALNNQTSKTKQFLTQLEAEGVEMKENSVLTACHAYLEHIGLDHVLMGLRKPAYVESLKGRFGRKTVVSE